MWVRGLKPDAPPVGRIAATVAPYVGAWIETRVVVEELSDDAASHPMWVRGLKPTPGVCPPRGCVVAPYVGAWIETAKRVQLHKA